jgi:hypothetical protein
MSAELRDLSREFTMLKGASTPGSRETPRQPAAAAPDAIRPPSAIEELV